MQEIIKPLELDKLAVKVFTPITNSMNLINDDLIYHPIKLVMLPHVKETLVQNELRANDKHTIVTSQNFL